MTPDSDDARLLASQINGVLRRTGHDTPEGPALLLGYALVAEWKAPDGTRWVTESHSDAVGEPLPEWTTAGYYHTALQGFPEEDEDDEEDGDE